MTRYPMQKGPPIDLATARGIYALYCQLYGNHPANTPDGWALRLERAGGVEGHECSDWDIYRSAIL